MGTRSFVGVMVGNKCRAIYVHYDGYLSGVGLDLQVYQTQAEVEKLISRGDRSSLDSGFYKDRGADEVDPVEYDSFEDFFNDADASGAEYYYIFKDGVWYCGDTYKNTSADRVTLYKTLTPYSEAVKTELQEFED